MERLARAKINLTLKVTGRRSDGYHLLDSLVVFAEFGDRLSVTEADDISLEISGPFAHGLAAGAGNLVIGAAHRLRAETGITAGAALRLEKNLPLASGLGGGSADCAAALNLLNEFWGLDLPDERLMALGLELGADVPVCLLSETALMQGIGDRVSTLDIRTDFALVLVNPGKAVSTVEIFRALGRDRGVNSDAPSGVQDYQGNDLLARLKATGNDLQPAAIGQVPEIGAVLDSLQALENCLLSRMSGSGATCFGLFGSLEEARAAASVIAAANPYWWTKAVSIR